MGRIQQRATILILIGLLALSSCSNGPKPINPDLTVVSVNAQGTAPEDATVTSLSYGDASWGETLASPKIESEYVLSDTTQPVPNDTASTTSYDSNGNLIVPADEASTTSYDSDGNLWVPADEAWNGSRDTNIHTTSWVPGDGNPVLAITLEDSDDIDDIADGSGTTTTTTVYQNDPSQGPPVSQYNSDLYNSDGTLRAPTPNTISQYPPTLLDMWYQEKTDEGWFNPYRQDFYTGAGQLMCPYAGTFEDCVEFYAQNLGNPAFVIETDEFKDAYWFTEKIVYSVRSDERGIGYSTAPYNQELEEVGASYMGLDLLEPGHLQYNYAVGILYNTLSKPYHLDYHNIIYWVDNTWYVYCKTHEYLSIIKIEGEQ